MSNEIKPDEEICCLKEKLKKDVEELVFSKFPKKILDLNELSKDEIFSPKLGLSKVDINIPVPDALISGEGLSQSVKRQKLQNKGEDEKSSIKPFLFPMGVVQCNKHLKEMINALKPHVLELIQDTILLKMGINLMVPKIEDGNNFGVEIQQETMEVIASIEDAVYNRLETFENYYFSRGEMIAKVAKYPHAEDFRLAVLEHDEKFHMHLCLSLTHIRNHYVSLHDMVSKNLSKIKQPRSASNKQMMY